MKNTTLAVSYETQSLVKELTHRDRITQSTLIEEALKVYQERYPLSREDIERIPVRRGRPPKKPRECDVPVDSLDI